MSTILTPGLVFDRQAHVYRYAGQRVPSVTSVIKNHLPVDTSHYTPEARDRGSAVHTAIEYHLDGDLNESSLHPIVRPYFIAYERFRDEVLTTPVLAEIGLAHPDLLYAGTLDLLTFVNWQGKERLALVDFKTGARQPWHDLQLAAYTELLMTNREELGLTAADRPEVHMVCQLLADGTYRIHQPKILMAQAWRLFASCLSLAHFTRSYDHGDSRDDASLAAA